MIFKGLLDLLFPEVCTACQCSLNEGEVLLCTQCRHEIPLFGWKNPKDNLVTDKLKGRVQLAYADSLFYFEKGNKTQALLHDLKYRNQKLISGHLGRWHGENLKQKEWAKDIDVIVPVPIHAKRRRERGYNQVEDYAREISQALVCKYNDKLLKRIHYSKTQVFKNRLSRIDVIKHNFVLNTTEDFSGKHIALADDLITTGATAEACFIQLAKLKEVKLSFIVMAVAP
jgi:ComF family protein